MQFAYSGKLGRYGFAKDVVTCCSSVTHLTNDSGTMGFLDELKVCMNVDVSEV